VAKMYQNTKTKYDFQIILIFQSQQITPQNYEAFTVFKTRKLSHDPNSTIIMGKIDKSNLITIDDSSMSDFNSIKSDQNIKILIYSHGDSTSLLDFSENHRIEAENLAATISDKFKNFSMTRNTPDNNCNISISLFACRTAEIPDNSSYSGFFNSFAGKLHRSLAQKHTFFTKVSGSEVSTCLFYDIKPDDPIYGARLTAQVSNNTIPSFHLNDLNDSCLGNEPIVSGSIHTFAMPETRKNPHQQGYYCMHEHYSRAFHKQSGSKILLRWESIDGGQALRTVRDFYTNIELANEKVGIQGYIERRRVATTKITAPVPASKSCRTVIQAPVSTPPKPGTAPQQKKQRLAITSNPIIPSNSANLVYYISSDEDDS
jgi:hypothetical protein